MRSRLALCVVFEGGGEAVEQRTLTLKQFRVRLGNGKPTGTVDFGEFADLARPLRPFELEGVAERALQIEVATHRERRDDLAARLLQRRQVDALSLRCRLAEFLLELAPRDGPRVLA